MLTRASSKLLAAAITAGCLWMLPGAASATLYYDLSGTCETDCSRFGIAEGTDFFFANALGLADGTDTSDGTRAVTLDSFTAFGLDFKSVQPFDMTFFSDMVVGFFLTMPSADGHLFCYNVPDTETENSTCSDGRFDTILGLGTGDFHPPATGGMGHGPAVFTKHAAAVPEPMTPLLLGIGLLSMGVRGRQRADA